MSSARVVVVEDDPNVRRFVQMALEPLGVDLVSCATLSEARQALEACGASVVLTDLALPDGSGLELLAWLQARSAAPGAPMSRAVVFSGGLDPSMQRRLEQLGAWRVLHKPSSVGELMGCVSQALASVADMPADGFQAGSTGTSDPVAEFFGGDRTLYSAYRQACLAQFSVDMQDGDRAASAADAAALRRVAHNLKSVLTLLGEARAAQCARSTEVWAAGGATASMLEGWQRLRAHIERLV